MSIKAPSWREAAVAFHVKAELSAGKRPRYKLPLCHVAIACTSIAAAALALPESGIAAEISTSFARNCAGCHANGGNIVQRGAGLSLQDLQKNSVASPDEIYKLVYYGKGKMPGYGKDCAPKGKCTFAARLPDEEIQQLSDYVLDRASKGWSQ